MRELLSKKNAWHWDQNQQKAFDEIKQALINSPVLAHYDVKAPKKVSADASSFGLGAVLLQKEETADKNSTWKPVAYASRAMTSVEQRYAQIEKESLAVTWACEKFSHYLIGTNFVIETDHKLLVPLLGSKDIAELPARIQRFRMRLMKFSYSVVHVPGKDLHTADTLSCAPIADFKESDQQLQEETQVFVDMVMNDIPATEKKLQEIKQGQNADPDCVTLKRYCEKGWPNSKSLSPTMTEYQKSAGEITVQQGLLMTGSQIIIPPAMREEMLARIHEGHQGLTKCRE